MFMQYDKNLTNILRVRVSKNHIDYIDNYAKFHNITRSNAIRQILTDHKIMNENLKKLHKED